MTAESYINNAHPSFIESIYESYQQDATTVDEGWRRFFEGFEFALHTGGSDGQNGHVEKSQANGSISAVAGDTNLDGELRVFRLIKAYRQNAHLLSKTNPIRERKDRQAQIGLAVFGLSEADLDKKYAVGADVGLGTASLKDILAKLKSVYAESIGLEYTYIHTGEARNWIRDHFESKKAGDYGFSIEKKKQILSKLNATTTLEQFLGIKYGTEKRFSLEGGESAIPALDAIINKGGDLGVKECVIGMAHRGRLNVLANIMGKTYDELFNEFEGCAPDDLSFGDGDVKYHMGFSSTLTTPTGKSVQLKLSPNPSHLEAVNPVVEGYSRAKADLVYESDYDQILPILIHGDAAVAGQGIVYEIVQMSKLPGYYTGGTIHFVINNQIGFTTDFDDARSSNYCTSIASIVEAPVIHVNGDDVEAVVFAAELAVEYRQRFNSDVFIDMVCYRKHGHNEADEPKYTQPDLYNKIKKHQNPRDLYREKLGQRNEVEKEMAIKMEKEFKADLQARLDDVRQNPLPYQKQEPDEAWDKTRPSEPADFEKSPKTSITKKTVETLAKGLTTLPDGFSPLRKLSKQLENQKNMILKDGMLDWASGELMAYGSILLEGKDVRMSGQDVKRGTFSHRHAVVTDEKNQDRHNRLNHLADKQGTFRIYNSLLSEFAVLGFEFGYAWATPENLVIWEAQFGDFVNGAQTMIDQFITAGESKWTFANGLVMLLPHGYAGQGPEHSSARLERFLQACADDNIVVCNITTPANFFHALRRQLAWDFRKPMIVMSPKSLLRHKKCVSPVSEITKGSFQEVIDDANTAAAKKVKRVLLCTGKIYYDLLAKKEEDKRKDVAIVRLEQLYPYPHNQIQEILDKYSEAEIYWVQEEPENMGAYGFMLRHFRGGRILSKISRRAAASPATGFKKIHLKEQAQLVEDAFA